MGAGLFDISGEHVFVTGASSGLGRRFASVLAEAGAKVSLGARGAAALAETVESIGADKAQGLKMDVTDAKSINSALAGAEERFGPVSVLINNAGVTASGSALDLDEAGWDRVVDTDLKGVWLTAQAAARRMIARGAGGAIVNIASILGLRVAGGVTPYAASKAGVVHLTKCLALEWARHGIRVNALAPGYIKTELNDDFFQTEAGTALIKRVPQRRLGQPSELDGPLLLLVSKASSFMTGSVIAVDGGHLVSSL